MTAIAYAPRRRGFLRERLPDPVSYYAHELDKVSRTCTNGWATARCPFHDDRQASLSVNLAHGGWRCHAGCGGGDLLAFHMRRHGLAFKEAAAALGAWKR